MCRDEFGIWWLVNVKAFALEKPNIRLMNLKAYTGMNNIEYHSDSEAEDKQNDIADKFEKEDVDLF